MTHVAATAPKLPAKHPPAAGTAGIASAGFRAGAGTPPLGEAGCAIRLRPSRLHDGTAIRDWVDSPLALFNWSGTKFTFPLDEAQWRRHATAADRPTGFAAVSSTGGDILGYGEIDGVDERRGVAEITHVIVDPAVRGQGVGTQVMEQLINIAFYGLDVVQIELGVFESNGAAMAFYDRLGFELDGPFGEVTLPEAIAGGGRPTATLYAMVLRRGTWLGRYRSAT